jgi:adenine-specific DNA-methyltransferase
MADRKPDPEGAHGEVFTRRWVVDLILDLVGYCPDVDLGGQVIVEPSCGCGAFLVPIVERLAQSCARHGRSLVECTGAIRAFDLLEHNAERSRKDVVTRLLELGQPVEVAERLAAAWVTTGDFLLGSHEPVSVDYVVGNPPYVRLEDIPPEVSSAYRAECATMRGRADLYVGFIEKGLTLLKTGGRLGFICADRWMRNQYGGRLRELVAASYAVDSVIVMHDVDAFEDLVSAYPAITILRNGEQGPARVVDAGPAFSEAAGALVASWVGGRGQRPVAGSFEAAELPRWFDGSGHWPTGSPGQLELLADLEARFPPLEDLSTGTRVGIGVATGCDDVYIATSATGVEPDRLLPLLTAVDIASGEPRWSGRYLVNPWDDAGLVDLDDYPGLAAYYRCHGARLRGRHVARQRPAVWYRTIDRVTSGLRQRPKLLLPDIKAAAHPVLDLGSFYPHHNLYYVVSDDWDLEVLGGLLLSDVTNLFVGAYCVKMRGGTYRFQAQYLRKVRVPDPATIPGSVEDALVAAFRARSRPDASIAAWQAYGLAPRPTLGGA